MSAALPVSVLPTIATDVQQFAVEKGVLRYLEDAIELASRAFPSSPPSVSLGQDAEDEHHRYIALDVEVGDMTADELLAGQRTWSAASARKSSAPRSTRRETLAARS